MKLNFVILTSPKLVLLTPNLTFLDTENKILTDILAIPYLKHTSFKGCRLSFFKKPQFSRKLY